MKFEIAGVCVVVLDAAGAWDPGDSAASGVPAAAETDGGTTLPLASLLPPLKPVALLVEYRGDLVFLL